METFRLYKKHYGEFHFNNNYRKHTITGLKSESGIILGEIVALLNSIKTPVNSTLLPGEYNSNKLFYKQKFNLDNITTAGLCDNDIDYHWNFEEDPSQLGKFDLIVSQAMLEHLINPYKHICDLEAISVGHAHMVRALPTGLLGRAQSPTEIGS